MNTQMMKIRMASYPGLSAIANEKTHIQISLKYSSVIV